MNSLLPTTIRWLSSLACIIASSISVHAAVTNVAWYRLGDNDPGATSGQVANTTTIDLVGSNQLRRFGPARYTNDVARDADQIGSALAVSFSGTALFSNSVVATTARNNFGIEAWVRTLSETAGTYVIAHNGNPGANGWGLQAVVSISPLGDPLVAYTGRFGGGAAVGGGTSRRAGAWTHLALVRDNGTNRFYLNGAAAGSASTTTPATPAGAFSIGGLPALVGAIDEVRVFTFAPGQFKADDLLVNQNRVVTQPAGDVTTNRATLRGSASAFALPTTAWFEWGATPDLGGVTSPVSFGNDFATTNFSASIAGLRGGDTFFYRAAASNALGVAFGATLSFSTLMAPGQGGFAVGFDGTDDFVEVSNDDRFNAFPLIATAWVKTTQGSGEAGLINKYVAGSSNGWNVGLVDGVVRAWYSRNVTNFVWDGGLGLNGGAINDGQWHHVAFNVDEGGGFLYVDGALRDARGWTGPSGRCSTSEGLKFGRYPGGAGEYFAGALDEVAVWQFTSHDPGTLQTNMNRGLLGSEIGLAAYHRFAEGTGILARNAARATADFGNGILRNGAQWVPGIVLRPAIVTRAPTSVRPESAVLNGVANPELSNTRAWFEFGPTIAYGNATSPQALGASATNFVFRQAITGLTENATYHFRAVASNALGSSYGIDQSFAATGTNMIAPREHHTATLLPNGLVLVTGGRDLDNQALASTELFDPATGKWSPAAPMIAARYNHSATVLPNGRVLVVGGQGLGFAVTLTSAELYDPATGTWSPTGPLKTNRVQHTATLLKNGMVLVAGGSGNAGLAGTAELYDVATGTWSETGVMSRARYSHTATLLQNGSVLVAGGLTTNQATSASAEVYNPASGSWTDTGSMTTNRYAHTATMLRDGRVLVVGGARLSPAAFHRSAELYSPGTGTWTNTGAMLNYRYFHTATLLLDGRVLASGQGIGIPSAYDPATGTWADVPGPDPSGGATATLLPNGNVLVAGGTFIGNPVADAGMFMVTNGGSWLPSSPLIPGRFNHTASMLPDGRVLIVGFGPSAIFDSAGNAWSTGSTPHTPRDGHRATLLGDGQVLVSGGYSNSFDAVRGAELFNPMGDTWSSAGELQTPRGSHTATLLADGSVLIAGGVSNSLSAPAALMSAERFDPATRTWVSTGSMFSNRVGHTATLLPNGKVLVAGGLNSAAFGVPTASAELYDPATGAWSLRAAMKHARAHHTATLLPNGLLLVAGGGSGFLSAAIAEAELYDPATDRWTAAGTMIEARLQHTATLLPNGQVLVARGYNLGYLSSAEVFDPVIKAWSPMPAGSVAALASTATLLSNGRVLFVGGWMGNDAATAVESFDLRQAFLPLFRSRIVQASSPLTLGSSLFLGGIQFRAFSEGTGGSATQSSPTDHPLVQLRRLDNEQIRFVAAAEWSPTNFTSAPLLDFPPGHVMVTVFASAIPGIGAVVNVTASPPLRIEPVSVTADGGIFQFGFLAAPNSSFTVLGSPSIAAPNADWALLGPAVEIAPGHYGFSDPQPPNQPRRFYRIQKAE